MSESDEITPSTSGELSDLTAVTPPPVSEFSVPPQEHAYPRPMGGPADANNDPLRFVIPVNPSGWAVAAGYVGLVSVLMLPAPIAIILSVIALRDLKKNPQKTGQARAIFGLIMGIFFSLAFIAMLISINSSKK